MADDPYSILGLPRQATQNEIRAAYHRLAKKYHPDLNDGHAAAEDMFKRVALANELLSDANRRAQYDRGEIDASGAAVYAGRTRRQHASAEAQMAGAGYDSFEEIFANILNQRGGGAGPARGHDEHYVLDAAFLDALNGATRRLTLPDGHVLDVKIPPGTVDGDILRLRGCGRPGRRGGVPGDALIEIKVAGHPFFKQEGRDVHVEVPLSLAEAVLGGRIMVPTPAGPVSMVVKPYTETGTELRLRGAGVPPRGHHKAGNLLVRLRVVLGPPDERLEAALRTVAAYNPRAEMDV